MARVDEQVILASGAWTTTQTLGPYGNNDEAGEVRAIEALVNLTAFTTAASLTLSIEENVDGTWRQVIAATALTATGVSRLRLGPDFPVTANVSATGLVGSQFRIVVTHGNANSHTYSVVLRRERR